jgi:tetratricopeptide (TPR) repeat protein
MEGARRIDEWVRIEKRVPNLGVVPGYAPSLQGGDLDLLPPEWEVLALIDGRRDLRAIAGTLGRSDFDIAKTLFGLESAGLITLVDPGTVSRGRGAPDAALLFAEAEEAFGRQELDRARAAAEQAGVVQPHHPMVHLLLGRIHLAAGRPGEAVDELRRAQRLDPQALAAYRLQGFALVQVGRFAEAVEVWDQWDRLAVDDEKESVHRGEVDSAKAAARLLDRIRVHG